MRNRALNYANIEHKLQNQNFKTMSDRQILFAVRTTVFCIKNYLKYQESKLK